MAPAEGWKLDEPSPFERVRVLDPEPEPSFNDQARASLAKVFPAFARARVAQQWAGLIDVTPDAVPVISAVEGMPGFFIATGFSGHGFGIGPGAGRLVADLVTGDGPVSTRRRSASRASATARGHGRSWASRLRARDRQAEDGNGVQQRHGEASAEELAE